MGDSYKINNNDGIYFITITVIGWVDLFTRKEYRDIIIESLKYCQNNKGLVLYAYVIMSNHVHMMISVEEGFEAQNIVRDFKKFTSKEIIKRIKEIGESRRVWLLNKFKYEAHRVLRGKDYKVWKDGYHAKELNSAEMIEQKLNYIHNNPVEAGIILSPEEYLYSSAKNYADQPDKLIEVTFAL